MRGLFCVRDTVGRGREVLWWGGDAVTSCGTARGEWSPADTRAARADRNLSGCFGAGSRTRAGVSNAERAVAHQAWRDERFDLRFEGNYVELESATVNNGVAKTGGTTANGGFNEVKASNLEGLTGKIAITYTFGRN